MSPSRPYRGSASQEEGLPPRLAAYSRYAALVLAQEDAVEEGDLERFAELSTARTEIQDQLGDLLPTDDQETVSEGPESRAALEEAMTLLRSALARDGRIQRTLASLRQEAGESIRVMENRRGQVITYLGGLEPGGNQPPSRVNRKG